MLNSLARKRAFAVWWKDVERWAIPTGLLLRQTLPLGWAWARVGSVVRQVTERVKADPEKEYNMAGVKWYGEGIFYRETVRGDGMSANQVTPLIPGALIYNRLFAWKASFAVVPPAFADCFVSSEFPQFIPDPERILPEYLYLFCTRNATIRAVNSASTGSAAVSRNRFKEEQFLGFGIALPPLAEQKAIVARWRKAQDEIDQNRLKINKIESQLEADFLREIGISVSRAKQRRGAFALEWKDIERWDTFFYRHDFIALEKQFLRIKHIPLGAAVRFISRNWKRSDFADGFFEYIEISLVTKNGGIVGCKRVAVDKAPSRATTFLMEGDIIISTTRPYLGAFAVVPAQYNGCVCSSGFALADRIAHDGLNKDFLMYFLTTSAGLRQMERRMTGGLYPAIVQDELEKIRIPLPPLAVQEKIMERVAKGRAEIAREQEATERLSKEIIADVEALILGSKTPREQ